MDTSLAPAPARFFVGVDVASETLAVALTKGPGHVVAAPATFANDPDGFDALVTWLAQHDADPADTLVCMEATGVYGEALGYSVHGRGFRLAVEDPARIRRAIPVAGTKTDAADARRIADYAARFLDELRLWSPAETVVEQVITLLTMREQLVREAGAKRNALHVLRRKVVQTPLAVRIADDALAFLEARIKEIDAARPAGRARSGDSSASFRRLARPRRCCSLCPAWVTCSRRTWPWRRLGLPSR